MGAGELIKSKPLGCKTSFIKELNLLIVYPQPEVTIRKIEILNKSPYKLNSHFRVEEGILFIDIERIK